MASDPNRKILDRIKTRIGNFRAKVGEEVYAAAQREVADLFAQFANGYYYDKSGAKKRILPSDDAYVIWKAQKWGFMERGWANGVLGFAIERGAIIRRYPTGFGIDFSRVPRIRRYVGIFKAQKAPDLGQLRKGWRSRIARRVSTKLRGEINGIGELGKRIGKKGAVVLTLNHLVQNFRGPVGALANGRITRRRA